MFLIVIKLVGNSTLKLHPPGTIKCKRCTVKGHSTGSEDAIKPAKVNILDYFRSSTNIKANKAGSRLMTQGIHKEFNEVFIGIRCFEGIFKLRVKEGSHPYQASARKVAYVLQQPLKEELYTWQKQEIIVPLDVEETSEWCNSFVLVPKANGKL